MSDEHPAMLSQLRHDIIDHGSRIIALEKVSAAREEQVRALYQTVGEIKQICSDIRREVAEMGEKTQCEILEVVSKLTTRVEALERRDGDKWRQAAGYVLASIIALAVGYLMRSPK